MAAKSQRPARRVSSQARAARRGGVGHIRAPFGTCRSAQDHDREGDRDGEDHHRVGGGDAAVLQRELPLEGLAHQHREVGAAEGDDDGEDLEGEDDAQDQRGLQARPKQRQRHLREALPARGAEHLGGLAVLLRDQPHAGDEDHHHDRRRPPDLGEDDGEEDDPGVLVAEEEDRPLDHPEIVERGVEEARLLEDRQPDQPRRQVRDAERDREDVEDGAAAPLQRRDDARHGERERELDRDDDGGEE